MSQQEDDFGPGGCFWAAFTVALLLSALVIAYH